MRVLIMLSFSPYSLSFPPPIKTFGGKLQRESKGFSYIEAIIATAILGIAVVGILMTVASIKKPAAKTDRALVAAYYGQEVLEDLRAKVDARDWNSGELSVTTTTPHTKEKVINGVTYKAIYYVVEDPETGSRQVDLSVDWPDIK